MNDKKEWTVKGPSESKTDPSRCGDYAVMEGTEIIGAAYRQTNVNCFQNAEQNAALFAVSRKMLEALKHCVNIMEEVPTLNGFAGLAVLENAKEVIKAAIGGTE